MNRFGVLVRAPRRSRLLLVLVAILSVMSPLMTVSSAQALVASTVTFTVAPSWPAPAETVTLSGVVSPVASGRTVWLQRFGTTSWSTVATVTTTSTGRFSGSVLAGAAGSKTAWRALARPTTAASQAISVTRAMTVVKPALSLTVPSPPEVNLAFTLSGGGYPARRGRVVVVQRLSGTTWVEAGRTTESSTGLYSVKTTLAGVGKYAYRAMALSWHGAAAVLSPTRAVTTHAPYILLTPSSAITGKAVKATGKLPGVYSRPVWVQRKSGTSWVTVVQATTTSTGSYATTFNAPAAGSYALRAYAPQVTVGGQVVKPSYVSGAKTLKVTAPTPGSISGTVTDAAGTHQGLANVEVGAFSPSGMPSEPMTPDSGFTTRTAADGSYKLTGLPAATDYMVCFHAPGATGGSSDALGYVDECYDNKTMLEMPTLVTVTAGATRTGVSATLAGGGAVSGTVTDAAGNGLAKVEVSAISMTAGAFGMTTTAADGSYTVTGLATSSTYEVCFRTPGATGGSSDALGYVDECYDNQTMMGRPTPVTVTVGANRTGVNAALAAGGAMSGTVTDAGGTHHGLAKVEVSVFSMTAGIYSGATTAADGSYTVTGLPTAADYEVCFFSPGATGGSTDALGYIDECYDNVTLMGMPTPVKVTVGANRTGVNADLAGMAP